MLPHGRERRRAGDGIRSWCWSAGTEGCEWSNPDSDDASAAAARDPRPARAPRRHKLRLSVLHREPNLPAGAASTCTRAKFTEDSAEPCQAGGAACRPEASGRPGLAAGPSLDRLTMSPTPAASPHCDSAAGPARRGFRAPRVDAAAAATATASPAAKSASEAAAPPPPAGPAFLRRPAVGRGTVAATLGPGPAARASSAAISGAAAAAGAGAGAGRPFALRRVPVGGLAGSAVAARAGGDDVGGCA